MARFTIALLEAQQWVSSSLANFLGPDTRVLVVSKPGVETWGAPTADLFVVDSAVPDPSKSVGVIHRVRELYPKVPILLLAWVSSEQLAVAALKAGVSDYFSAPIELKDGRGRHPADPVALGGRARRRPWRRHTAPKRTDVPSSAIVSPCKD